MYNYRSNYPMNNMICSCNKQNSKRIPTKNTWYYPANSPSYVTYKIYGSYSGRNRHSLCGSMRNF